MRRTSLTVVALLTVLLTATGCTVPGTSPSTAPPSATESATTVAATEQPTESPSAEALPVLASKSVNFSEIPATIMLNQVIVRDGVTSITWTLRNDDDPTTGQRLGIQMTGQFSDGQYATVPGSNRKVPDDGFYVDGAYLLDTVNKLRYLPARDSEGRCVCTYAPSSVFVRPGASQSFDAVFKALPDGVTTVDVVIPRAGTFRGVQVQR